MQLYHIGVSGGKDSTAVMLWMKYESGIPENQIRVSFCNTGNETDDTLNHIRMLSDKVMPIEWLNPGLDFYELAKKKKRFPSAKARFCTQELKTRVTQAHLLNLMETNTVIAVTGVRAQESIARSKLLEREFDWTIGAEVWRPILKWTIEDVWAIHKKYGISPNPMYAKGAARVGCAPCIFSRKSEIRMLAREYPERIERIARHEKENGYTLFSPDKTPKQFHDLSATNKSGESVTFASIYNVVAWARNGNNLDFESELFDDSYFCDVGLGQCE